MKRRDFFQPTIENNDSCGIFAIVALGFVKAFTYLYEILSWPLYVLLCKQKVIVNEQGPICAYPVVSGDPASPWRNALVLHGELPSLLVNSCLTLDQLSDWIVKKYGDKPAFGTRNLLGVEYNVESSGRCFEKLRLGTYQWKSYNECDVLLKWMAAGFSIILKQTGVSEESLRSIVCFAETRMQWFLSAQACFRSSIVFITLYPTLGEDAVVFGVNQTESRVILTSDNLLSRVVGLLSRMPHVQVVIYMESHFFNKSGSVLVDVEALEYPEGVKLLSLEEVQRLGKHVLENDEEINVYTRPQHDDVAIVTFTSGSSGTPKGVVISHGNLLAAMVGMVTELPEVDSRSDCYLAYLPLSHILELACELVMYYQGISIGYGSPLTLTDNSSKVQKGSMGDASQLEPTLLCCVPSIADRIHKSVWQKVDEGGAFRRELFKWALTYRRRRLSSGFKSFFLEHIVFRKIQSVLGGHIRIILCGGAPLSVDAQDFMNICFGRVIVGYGLSETCGACSLSSVYDIRGMHVGCLLQCLEVRLREWKEADYSPLDKEGPRGEILIGGKCVALQYYKLPEVTSEAFFEDTDGKRWFCTGDIGMFNKDGTLSIIDRKKDLVKLSTGEYISLSKVELALGTCNLLDLICIYANSFEGSVVAIAVANRRRMIQLLVSLNMLASEDDLDDESYEAFLNDPKVLKTVLCQLHEIAASKKLHRTEYPSAIYLDSTPWTSELGLVTAALKLKRREISLKFETQIRAMYESI